MLTALDSPETLEAGCNVGININGGIKLGLKQDGVGSLQHIRNIPLEIGFDDRIDDKEREPF